MSTFECKVYKIKVESHPNADNLEVARIGDFRAIVRRGDFSNGDMAAYIPEGAMLPQDLVKEMGLEGKLAGPDKNRVKAIRLRGVLSQGLVFPARRGWSQGMDVAPDLGVWKYEPVIPAGFAGEVMSVGGRRTLKYDIENIKKHPDLFMPGEQVTFGEKLHGTAFLLGVMGKDNLLPGPYSRSSDMQPDETREYEESRLVIASKGIAAKGLAFKLPWTPDHPNWNNVYCKTARKLDIVPAVEEVFGLEQTVFILGEIFGANIQDLTYGLSEPEFRIFDIYVGNPGEGRFLNNDELTQKCLELGIPRVPVLYVGPFSRETLEKYTSGKETVSGTGKHTREGVVVRSCVERTSGTGDLPCGDRMQLKSVSEDYLLRRGNVTEYT